MTPHKPTWHASWPWLLIILVVAIGPLINACAAPAGQATATPTKTPRPDVAATPPAVMTEPPLIDTTGPAPTASDMPSYTPPATLPPASATQAPEASPQAATPAPQQPARGPGSAMSSPDFGAQAFLWWRGEVADRDLGLLKDGGFRWVKQLFSWQDIEGAGKGDFDWSNPDRLVDQVQKHGLKLLVRISADPDKPFWGGQPPASTRAFAEFAAQVATRYRGRIQAYQIWNEPNLAREWGQQRPDPAAYAAMLKATYAAIKAADPSAIVISAGMAPTTQDNNEAMPDLKFYQGLYDAMGKNSTGYFDMLGAHAAGYAVAPDTDPQVVVADPKLYNNDPSAPELLRVYSFRHLEDVRALMVRNGDANKRIAILEFGWSTDNRPDSPYYWHGAGAGIDDLTQAKYLVGAYKWATDHWQPWIGVMIVIYMPDVDWTRQDEQYYWSIIGPGYPDTFWRAAYIHLCAYLNGLSGQRCKYDPGQ